jgi:hypothetical protein
MVVVRAGDSQEDIPPPASFARRRLPTLRGLDQRERLDTLPDAWERDSMDPEATSAASSVRARPAVLLDGVDDEQAQEYLAEAERILREGRLVLP